MTAPHLCLTCRLAEWQRTTADRIHPSGQGKCVWTPAHIPTPAAWTWDTWGGWRVQPKPSWGHIDRRRANPITECETYEAMA